MYILNEGEIVFKEKYGSTSKELFYVQPPNQQNIVVLDDKKLSNVSSCFTKIFLPQGYPESVSKDYIAYQIWDTAQAFCSTITGTLATQEVLRGVGVGDTSATPLAATITWVIKDGCGHLGKIIFAFTHGTYLDAYSKEWRLYADTLNDAAMCIEISLPLFKKYTTFALCVSTVIKAIVGVAGGATRAAMTQHHAVRGNLADVSAKDSAQETAVNLVASFTALLLITLFGNSYFIFILMMILHIIFNYLAVRSVCLKTLNEPRFLQVIDKYLRQEIVAAPCEINKIEPIIFSQLGPNLLDLKICGFKIKLGCSIKQQIKENSKASYMKSIKDIYADEKYILLPSVHDRMMHVLLKEDCDIDKMLHAYFNAVLLAIIICAINEDELPTYSNAVESRPFARICKTLQSAEWSREPVDTVGSYSAFQYNPSYDLMKYVVNIAGKEWNRIRMGLSRIGWDLSKHLLMVDEWRISNCKINTNPISCEEVSNNETVIFSGMKVNPFGDLIDNIDSEDILEKDTFTIEPELSTVKVPSILKLKQDFNPDKKNEMETALEIMESKSSLDIKTDRNNP